MYDIYLSVLGEPEAEDGVEIGEEGAVKGDPDTSQVVRQHWLESSLRQVKYFPLLRITSEAASASLLLHTAVFNLLRIAFFL